MLTARSGHVAGIVHGKIYVAGGGNTVVLDHVEQYDPLKDQWRRQTSLLMPRYCLGGGVLGQALYTVGGGSIDLLAVPQVEQYIPGAKSWRVRSAMPTPRLELATSCVDGRLYALGGWQASQIALSTVEEYTPDDWPFAVSSPVSLDTLWGEIKVMTVR